MAHRHRHEEKDTTHVHRHHHHRNCGRIELETSPTECSKEQQMDGDRNGNEPASVQASQNSQEAEEKKLGKGRKKGTKRKQDPQTDQYESDEHEQRDTSMSDLPPPKRAPPPAAALPIILEDGTIAEPDFSIFDELEQLEKEQEAKRAREPQPKALKRGVDEEVNEDQFEEDFDGGGAEQFVLADPVFAKWREVDAREFSRTVEQYVLTNPLSHISKLSRLMKMVQILKKTNTDATCVYLTTIADVLLSILPMEIDEKLTKASDSGLKVEGRLNKRIIVIANTFSQFLVNNLNNSGRAKYSTMQTENHSNIDSLTPSQMLTVRCTELIGRVLVSRMDFPGRDEMCACLVHPLISTHNRIRTTASGVVRNILNADKDAWATLRLVQAAAKKLKAVNYRCPADFISPFEDCKIGSNIENVNPVAPNSTKYKGKGFASKKTMQQRLEAELARRETETRKKMIAQLQSATLSELFLIYVRIIRIYPERFGLLEASLNGVEKFGRGITTTYLMDLVSTLAVIVARGYKKLQPPAKWTRSRTLNPLDMLAQQVGSQEAHDYARLKQIGDNEGTLTLPVHIGIRVVAVAAQILGRVATETGTSGKGLVEVLAEGSSAKSRARTATEIKGDYSTFYSYMLAAIPVAARHGQTASELADTLPALLRATSTKTSVFARRCTDYMNRIASSLLLCEPQSVPVLLELINSIARLSPEARTRLAISIEDKDCEGLWPLPFLTKSSANTNIRRSVASTLDLCTKGWSSDM